MTTVGDITDRDKVSYHTFSWCETGQHMICKRSYRKFVIERNKLVYLDEVSVCSCKKRGCSCYIKPANRVKSNTPKRRRK